MPDKAMLARFAIERLFGNTSTSVDGGSDGGADGGAEGGAEGGPDGGSDGGVDGGSDGGAEGSRGQRQPGKPAFGPR